MTFRCPVCNEVVASDVDEADEILKPKGMPVEGVKTAEGEASHATQA
jgi:hypothetical protein